MIVACAPLSIRASKDTALKGLDEPSLADAMLNQARYPAFPAWKAPADRLGGAHACAGPRPTALSARQPGPD